MIYIQSKVSANMLIVESDFKLDNIAVYDENNSKTEASLICQKYENGKIVTMIDASNLEKWSPQHNSIDLLGT